MAGRVKRAAFSLTMCWGIDEADFSRRRVMRAIASALTLLLLAGAAPAAAQPRQPRDGLGRGSSVADASREAPLPGVGRAGRSSGPGRKVRDYSWIYIDLPEPHEIKVHDIVTIIVDEKSEVTIQSRFNRQKNSNLKAELKEFVRINDRDNLDNAAQNSPTIDTNLTGRFNTTGQVADQEGIRYRIAATVVDVLPNGNIVLEARKTIQSNHELWEYTLTGVVRSADIARNNTALSENIANLKITKYQRGKVYDSTKRPWGVVLYDLLSPF